MCLNTGSPAGGAVLRCFGTLGIQNLVGGCGSLRTGLGLCGPCFTLFPGQCPVRMEEKRDSQDARSRQKTNGTWARKWSCLWFTLNSELMGFLDKSEKMLSDSKWAM